MWLHKRGNGTRIQASFSVSGARPIRRVQWRGGKKGNAGQYSLAAQYKLQPRDSGGQESAQYLKNIPLSIKMFEFGGSPEEGGERGMDLMRSLRKCAGIHWPRSTKRSRETAGGRSPPDIFELLGSRNAVLLSLFEGCVFLAGFFGRPRARFGPCEGCRRVCWGR